MNVKKIVLPVINGLFLLSLVVVVIVQGQELEQLANQVAVNSTMGTAFTYQGMLQSSGGQADGTFDFQFRLYDAVSGGSQVGSTVTLDDVAVNDGLFTVVLDFGANVLGGSPRWLAISVRPGSGGSYETLSPRQPLNPTPYAIHAWSAGELKTEMAIPAVITATANTGGGLPSGTYYFKIVASDGVGTTRASAEVSCTVDGVTTDRCALAWEAVPGAAAYRVYKGATSQGQDRYQSSSSNSYNYDGDSGATLDAVPTVTTAYVNNINSAGDSWLLGGNLGIGTTSSTAKLDVAGNLNFDGQKACSIVSIATGDSWRDILLVPSDWTAGACDSLRNDFGTGGYYQLFCVFENTYSFGAPGGGIPNPNCGW